MKHGGKRILILGADGLRPDMVDPEVMPACWRLFQEGHQYRTHRAAYPSQTRVQMTTLSTGTLPGRHGVVANSFYVPGVGVGGWLNTGNHHHIAAFQDQTGEPFVRVPTLGDHLQGMGLGLGVVGTGSPGAALLWNLNHPEKVLHPQQTWEFHDPAAKEVPPMGAQSRPGKVHRIHWGTEAFLRVMLPNPDYPALVLWLSEPDGSLHLFGAGSEEVRDTLREVDHCVGRVIEAIEKLGVRDEFNILFLSDHGHTAVQSRETLRQLMESPEASLSSDAWTLATSVIYPHDPATPPGEEEVSALFEMIARQPWCDLLFCRDASLKSAPAGVLPLSTVYGPLEHERSPLAMVSGRWWRRANPHGFPGTVEVPIGVDKKKTSTHGSLCPYDLHCLCNGIGPDFSSGSSSETPNSAIDVAPTLLHLLGRERGTEHQGRVLREGLRGSEGPEPTVETEEYRPAPVDARAAPPGLLRVARVEGSTAILGSCIPGEDIG